MLQGSVHRNLNAGSFLVSTEGDLMQLKLRDFSHSKSCAVESTPQMAYSPPDMLLGELTARNAQHARCVAPAWPSCDGWEAVRLRAGQAHWH